MGGPAVSGRPALYSRNTWRQWELESLLIGKDRKPLRGASKAMKTETSIHYGRVPHYKEISEAT